MSIGSWDPTAGSADTAIELSPELLDRLAGFSREDMLNDLAQQLSATEQQTLAALMQVDHGEWRSVADSMSDEDITHLLRFFAVAENLPGWEAGEKSPVIPLAKLLRKRGQRLDRETLLWLREVNNNRFLPYGPL